MLAKYNGTCPVCGKFIVKGRSKVARLNAPQKPSFGWSECDRSGPSPCSRKHHGRRYTILGSRIYRDGEVASLPRAWAHERCAS